VSESQERRVEVELAATLSEQIPRVPDGALKERQSPEGCSRSSPIYGAQVRESLEGTARFGERNAKKGVVKTKIATTE